MRWSQGAWSCWQSCERRLLPGPFQSSRKGASASSPVAPEGCN